jgi:2-keto-4-pentenoate hydratase
MIVGVLVADATVENMARDIAEAHRARARFVPMTADRIGDLDFAYGVQDRLVSHWRNAGEGAIIGWKVGLTSARMQAMTGISQPASGAILARREHASGAVLRKSDFIHLGLEAEIAVRVGEPFPEDQEIEPAEALNRLESVSAAFEIVDDRNADYARLDAASLIADNSWNLGVVLGRPILTRGLGGLAGRRGVLTVNGELQDQGMSEDAGGDPLKIVAWLAAHLVRRGQPLQPGQWIMTGSIITTKFPATGDRYHFAVGGLEPVEARIA